MAIDQPLLSVSLSVDYPRRPQALSQVCFQIHQGEVLGLVGQSGSGKSTIALALLRLLHLRGGRASGFVRFRGRDLMTASEREMRRIRGAEIGLVLQSPMSSLNPALRIGAQLAEAWRAHASGTKGECQRCVEDALASVGLPANREFRSRYPLQVSVGQAQRILVAMALMHQPSLLVADEPTSALDAITQAEIMKLFSEVHRSTGTTMLYISHDLLSVASLCHRIAILHDGEIVECGIVEEVLRHPVHEYSRRLFASLPFDLSRKFARDDAIAWTASTPHP